jgi:hypothetical protein
MSEREIPQFPELQILSPGDQAEVLAFSRARANKEYLFLEWSAPWRQESLEHYLKIGWSMARRDRSTGKLVGYILAQPFLFLRRQTQTVWIEHVEGETPAINSELIDTVIRISREKHMQRVLMDFQVANVDLGLGELIRTRNGRLIEEDILEFATTKS